MGTSTITARASAMSSARALILFASAIGVSFLLLYLLTASHTVILHHDDSAEFQTVGNVGGILHHPYPLWCILARSFCLLPIGEPAFRTTLMSIVFAIATLLLLFLVLRNIIGDSVAALAACVSLGLCMTFWQNAVVSEVYSLNAFLIVMAVFVWIRWLSTHSKRDWFLFSLVIGFVLSHHQQNLAVLPALGAMIYFQRERIRHYLSGRDLLTSAFALLLPFTLYFYTYLMDSGDFRMDWLNNYGEYLYAHMGFDIDRFGGFVERLRFQLFVARFGPVLPSANELMSRLLMWIRHVLAFEYPFWSSALVLLGGIALWRANIRAGFVSTIYVVCALAIALVAGGGVNAYTYAIPVFLVFSGYLAFGISKVRDFSGHWKRGPVVPVVLVLLLVLFPFFQFSKLSLSQVIHLQKSQLVDEGAYAVFWHLRASDGAGKKLGSTVSEIVPPESLIFARWSAANVLLYYKYVLSRFDGVEISYFLPTRQFAEELIAAQQPKNVYVMFTPDRYDFVADEVISVIPGYDLYRIDLDSVRPVNGR